MRLSPRIVCCMFRDRLTFVEQPANYRLVILARPMQNSSVKTIVFLAGIGTRLSVRDGAAESEGTIPDFWGADRLVPHIRGSGIPARFLVYSYRGNDGQTTRVSESVQYSAIDTLNRHLSTYVARLDQQLRSYAELHPSSEFHLIGHSEGGLIAFAYLAQMERANHWRLPNDARLAGITTLDAPLGGIATTNRLRMTMVRAYLALTHHWLDFSSVNDLLQIYRTSNSLYPLGGRGSVMEILERGSRGTPMSNQELALAARHHGVRVLTIGNVRDYCFDPGHGFEPFVSTQWISDAGPGSGVHGRWVVLGRKRHSLGGLEVNHGVVLGDPSVHEGILSFIRGGDPNPLLPAPTAESMTLWLKQENPNRGRPLNPPRHLHA